MSRLIYLVTHGQKDTGPNPGLTPLGKQQIAVLKPHLLRQIHSVICGVGRRHLETAQMLGLKPDRYSSVVGAAESKNRQNNTVVLADGTEVPYEKYSSVEDRQIAFLEMLKSLPDRTVIVTSRPVVSMVKPNYHSKEAALYRYQPETGNLEEVFAASADIGAGDQEV